MLSHDAYLVGHVKAAAAVGLPHTVRTRILRALEGPHGELLTRLPLNMASGALVGGATGTLTDHAAPGAAIGAAAAIPGTLAYLAAPGLRRQVLAQLRRPHPTGMKISSMRGIMVRRRKSPFEEISRRIAKVFRLRVPKINVEAQIKRLFRNPFKLRRGGMLGKLKM